MTMLILIALICAAYLITAQAAGVPTWREYAGPMMVKAVVVSEVD